MIGLGGCLIYIFFSFFLLLLLSFFLKTFHHSFIWTSEMGILGGRMEGKLPVSHVLFSFVFAFSKGELHPHIGGIVIVVVWGAPTMVVGISKRRRGGQASHLQIYKRRG